MECLHSLRVPPYRLLYTKVEKSNFTLKKPGMYHFDEIIKVDMTANGSMWLTKPLCCEDCYWDSWWNWNEG